MQTTQSHHSFTEKELDVGEYILMHKPMWFRALVFTLYFATLVIVSVFAVKWIPFLTGSLGAYSFERELSYTSIPWSELREQHAPTPVSVHSIAAIASRNNVIDVTAVLTNPNEEWRASKITYQVSVDGVSFGSFTTFLLPRIDQRISVFNVPTTQSQARVQIDITDVTWQRVRDRAPLGELQGIVVDDVSFGNEIDLNTFEVAARLRNTSSKSFWLIGLQIVAKRFGTVAGVNYVAAEQVRSGTDHEFRVVWPTTLSGVDVVEITPVVDVYNEGVYMPLDPGDFPLDPSGVELED